MAAASLTAPPADQELLDLARVRLADLTGDEPPTTLDAVMRRLFDPRDRERLTVSAFASSL